MVSNVLLLRTLCVTQNNNTPTIDGIGGLVWLFMFDSVVDHLEIAWLQTKCSFASLIIPSLPIHKFEDSINDVGQ